MTLGTARPFERAHLAEPAPPMAPGLALERLAALEQVQARVLWLATRMVHEANHVRPNPDGSKVGGHQASTASLVSVITALYFGWLRAGDRVAVKPHASPAFHASQYLLGNLDRSYLTTLRSFHGLQAYPSRTKDPDPVDFSTGSVGLGIAATLFAALADRYVRIHFPEQVPPCPRRFVGLVGDAELDEGNIWEAIADPAIQGARLGNVLWVVDLNRQSLDRVVPGIRARQLEAQFLAAGWQVLEAKYGRRLQDAFARPGGVALRRRIDDMPNEEYQSLVRMAGPRARQRLLDGAPPTTRDALARSIEHVPDDELPAFLGDLGGHDLAELLAAFDQADREAERPTILFAYTMKGWGLPIAGDPLNHSALLTPQQLDEVRVALGADPADDWAALAPGTAAAQVCQEARARLYEAPTVAPAGPPAPGPSDVPTRLATRHAAQASSQEAFGNTLVELARLKGGLAERLVTTSPDVSISTNLGGWINRVGVFAVEAGSPGEDEAPRLLRWQPAPEGQHVELGIGEMNLFLLLGQLGLSAELLSQCLVPIGTVYDPFICRGLDALIYGVYAGSRFVFAGTPSGVTLSPEGGAHQSSITVSIGMELPNLQAYEPCFARETEWCLLEGIRHCLDRQEGLSTYLRLSTRPVDQGLATPALERLGEEALRAQVLRGGYRLVEPPPEVPADAPRVILAASGAVVPEVIAAAGALAEEGVAAVVLNLTSASRLYREWQQAGLRAARQAQPGHESGHLASLIPPPERRAPIVTVVDGASHSLAFLGSAFGQRLVPLGVDAFGQSGLRSDLYQEMGIDVDHVVNAALLALGE